MIASRLGAGVVLLCGLALPAAAQQQQPQAQQPSSTTMQETVVTATGRPEEVTRFAGTVQVIDQERIAKSTGKSVTDLLAENSVGFLSEWTAGQTSLNIRGAATEGQGRDFKSEILILINGHRAGTANISKLSMDEVERIEIVRGPASVIYGSQNMGGVVNIILKTGRSSPGGLTEGRTGSFGLYEGKLQYGGTVGADGSSGGPVDYFAGAHGGTQNSYNVGGGALEQNTGWTREGGIVALGWQIDSDNRVDVLARTDGVYNTGFRGSSADLFAFDTRYNQSVDVTWNAKTPDGRLSLMFQGYYVEDVDDLNNPSPVSNTNAATLRTSLDHNHRVVDLLGMRFQPRYKIIPSNELLVGFDFEKSWITSYRERQGGSAITPAAPQDNNETDNVFGLYIEDEQRLFSDRLTLRSGIRQTFGTQQLLPTPNANTLIPGSVNYQATTWSTGATMQATSWLTGRIGASTGFRAPTATELGSNFTITPIGTTIFGNPSLSPETNQQFEVGATATTKNARLDLALFQNTIYNRIAANTISSVGGVVIQQYQNNPGALVVQGLELQTEADVMRTLGLPIAAGDRWSVFANGYYNFKMTDYGAPAAALSQMGTRMYLYEASIGTRYAKIDAEMPWNLQLLGIWRGPMWYNTEERLAPNFFPGQVVSTTVYEKAEYWTFNARGEIEIYKGLKLFGALNNIFDVNASPIFIATDVQPCVANVAAQNGSCGNSMQGRNFFVGAQWKF
jgi:vitamin B12 transporter